MRITLLLMGLGLSALLAMDCGPRSVDGRDRFASQIPSPTDYMAGWHALGTCTARNDLTRANRDSVMAHLQVMRRHGLNTVLESASADGRIIARGPGRGKYNWYGYTYHDADGNERSGGHPPPGVFVEGIRWLLNAAYGREDDPHISVIVSLPGFVAPGYRGRPHDGSERITCAAYQDFIQNEIESNGAPVRARIPPVACRSRDETRPFWEWNLWYVITNLSDHPGLRGWYLWDEPEGVSYRHLFGSQANAPRRFDGPNSLPTTDLLRYVYQLVKQFDTGDHPVIVDIHSPHVFFSNRFAWSHRVNPRWSSGPFDITPSGEYGTPADVLGLEAGSYMAHTRPAGQLERMVWYWDQNHVSLASAMLGEAAARDGLQAMVIAAQAQLPSEGPFAASEPLRCGPNDQMRARLLSDSDLIWGLLTTHIDGMQGYVYYSHALMPYRGPGAEQIARSHRLLGQFLDARLDRVFAQPAIAGRIDVEDIRIHTLTDYYRVPPTVVGTAKGYSSRFSNLSESVTVRHPAYRAGVFNRSDAERNYGEPTIEDKTHVLYPNHELLRVTLRSWDGADYLALSNAYDARITAQLTYRNDASNIAEGQFDLSQNGLFRWSAGTNVRRSSRGEYEVLEIDLEPYEARLYRIQ